MTIKTILFYYKAVILNMLMFRLVLFMLPVGLIRFCIITKLHVSSIYPTLLAISFHGLSTRANDVKVKLRNSYEEIIQSSSYKS